MTTGLQRPVSCYEVTTINQVINPQFIDRFQTAFTEGDENAISKVVETENVRRVEEVFRALASRDFDALNDVLTEEVTFEIVGSPGTPLAGLTKGREQVIEAVRNNFAQLEEQQPEILTVVAQGDTVVVVGRERGRFRPTGRDYELNWMHEYRFRGDKIAHMRELVDSAALLDVVRPLGD